MIECHYRRLGTDGEFQLFESTDGTRSNWTPEIQHGSPPLALMTKLIEDLAGDSGLRVGRLTLDILGPNDTTVHLHRLPAGNDFALRARGSFGPDRIGVTTADIFDRRGFVGTSAQTVLVQRRRSLYALASI